MRNKNEEFLSAKEQILTAEEARTILSYDPETGAVTWKIDRRGVKQGTVAGCIKWGGTRYRRCYRCVKINGIQYVEHRLIWLLVTGNWPTHGIDHENGDGLDNRQENLRDVPGSVNSKNMKMNPRNTSGVNGVFWNEKRRRWVAHIQVDGKHINLGRFRTKEDAIESRRKAETDFGFHKNHGLIRTPSSPGISVQATPS